VSRLARRRRDRPLPAAGVRSRGQRLVGLAASAQVPEARAWPRVHIEDAFTRAAVEWTLTGSAEWLATERCRGLLSEFSDEQDRPLADRLAAFDIEPQAHLALLLFRDGSGSSQCANERTFAVTTPGGRVLWVCGRRFERLWRADRARAQAVVIHEMLDTFGLGENPPPGPTITARVLALCDPTG